MGKNKEKKAPKEPKEPKVKNNNEKNSLIIKIISYVLLLAFIAGCTYFGVYYGIKKATGDNKSVENTESKPSKVENEVYFEIGEMTVNLKEDSGKRYVRLNLTVGHSEKNKDLTKEIESKKGVLTDAAIFYLKSCAYTDFTAGNETVLKENLIKKLNEKLESGTISSIIFTDLIIQ